jgi:hypothetical protein
MMRVDRLRKLAFGGVLLGAVYGGVPADAARADTPVSTPAESPAPAGHCDPPVSPDPDASRIAAAGHSLEWNWVPPGRSDRFGHAETLIHAPMASVREHVLDFPQYHTILPGKFQQSRVVAHGPDRSTDVYIQIAVLHGVIKLWDITRFSAPQATAPGVEIVEGHMLRGKGNVDDMQVMWTMRALNDEWTVLKLDMLLKPGLPVPQSSIDEELRDSARYAVDSVHDRAQGSKEFAAWPGSG